MVSLALDLRTSNQTEAELWGCGYSEFLGGGICWNRHICEHLYILCVCKNSSVFQINASSLLVILADHCFGTKIILNSFLWWEHVPVDKPLFMSIFCVLQGWERNNIWATKTTVKYQLVAFARHYFKGRIFFSFFMWQFLSVLGRGNGHPRSTA